MPFSKRDSKPGPALVFITTPTRDHMPLFSLPHLAHQAVLQLGRAASEFDAGVAGYCLLPASLSAIISFYTEYELAGFMYHYKWLSSRAMIALDHGRFSEQLYRKGKFRPWMGRFDQFYISTMEQFKARLDYIHHEPVRCGLVDNPAKYDFSSAGDWLDETPGLIKIEKLIQISV
jgi:hypothetical protein